MKKIFLGAGICIVLILVSAVFATAASSSEDVGEIIEKISNSKSIGDEVKNYIGKFVEKRGIKPERIKNIELIDFNDLPKEVNIENVDDTNLAIYEIDYDEGNGEDKKVFMVTYSVEELRVQGDLIIAHDKRQFLNFGFGGEMIDSGFLETATGVEGSLDSGYVMMREGSITGLSTSLEVVSEDEGQIEIIVYKNGEKIGFGNSIAADSLGVEKDYDVQSNDVVAFEPGDMISVYVNAPEGIVWKDVITMVEITTMN